MEKNAREVISPGIQFPKGVFKSKEYPCQWLIGAQPVSRERPAKLVYAQTLKVGVLEKIGIVVPFEKVVCQYRDKGKESDCNQNGKQEPRCDETKFHAVRMMAVQAAFPRGRRIRTFSFTRSELKVVCTSRFVNEGKPGHGVISSSSCE